jgi:hypothetical protein
VPLGFGLASTANPPRPAAGGQLHPDRRQLPRLCRHCRQARRGETAWAKSFFYSTGLAEGAETIAVFIAMCLWPAHFPAIAYGFAALCLLTVTRAAHRRRT